MQVESMYVARQWELDDLISTLQRKLAREINVARNAQRSATNEKVKVYLEGRADALGDVLLFLEDLRGERA